jgi:hypothetical protein
MRFTIKEKADYVGTLRASFVFLMETLARWVPCTPEMEVKILFGRHLWDMAQHAGHLGKRTYELRAPLHYSIAPSEPFLRFLKTAATAEATGDRVFVFYNVVLPAMDKAVQNYLAHTDRLQDEPTVRILDGILRENTRLAEESRKLLAELPNIKAENPDVWKKLGADNANVQFVNPEAMSVAVEAGA